MITTLVSNTYKAVKSAYVPASKLPQNMRKLPVCQHLRIASHNGRMIVTCLTWDGKKDCLDAHTESIPARIDTEFAACIPARQFKDWLAASQLTKEEKRIDHPDERLTFAFDADTMTVTLRIRNARATFKALSTDEFPRFPIDGEWIN